MLPFDQKPWAKPVARMVIAATILGIAAAAYYLHTLGPLDTGEILAFILLALTIIPTNLAVIYRKPKVAESRQQDRPDVAAAVHQRP
jgi:hypothetical protein